MAEINQQEKRFASFIIYGNPSTEFAIGAEEVLEATPILNPIQSLSSGVHYLEGLMHLRDDAIPIINLKKRLALDATDYTSSAKVAVVYISGLRVGLMFDDIKDVLVVDKGSVEPIHPALQNGEGLISDLIKLSKGQRTLQLLDLKRLLEKSGVLELDEKMNAIKDHGKPQVQRAYSRFVVFSSQGQDYGIPVDKVQEITFLSKVDNVFENDAIEGAMQLRGSTIPVLGASRLLHPNPCDPSDSENTRILVLNGGGFQYGLIVDSVREISAIAEDEILPIHSDAHNTVRGIYQRINGQNIMLLQADALIKANKHELKSVANLKSSGEKELENKDNIQSRHLITADCYLVFSIGRNFAIELNDVQEIIESKDLMELPAATGFDRRVLNLRGSVVPVINLRVFYDYPDDNEVQDKKLIIARNNSQIVALEVDHILTIYKQVQYRQTPSLNPQLADKKDTLDRLIEYTGDSGVIEHVLVVNIKAMIQNHLVMSSPINTFATEMEIKEEDYGSNGTAHE